MALSDNQRQVTWSAANTVSVAAGGNQTSDEVSLSATRNDANVTLKAENAAGASAASGDVVEIWALRSCGDPDAEPDVASEYPSDGDDGDFLAVLDTYTGADGVTVKTVVLPIAAPYVKLFAKSKASSNAITVSACINERIS